MRAAPAAFLLLIAAGFACAAKRPPEAVNLVLPPEPAFLAWSQRVLARFLRPLPAADVAASPVTTWVGDLGATLGSRGLARPLASNWGPRSRARRHPRWRSRAQSREAPISPGSEGDLAKIRIGVLERLNALNGTASAKEAPEPLLLPGAVEPSLAAPVASPSKPPCAEMLDLYSWQRRGRFEDVLASLRAAVARSGGAAPDSARLAEFYLVNGLANEAVSAAESAQTAAGQRDRERLAWDADIAHLARGEAIASDSPLLSDNPNCERRDLGLWRALQAAGTGDPQSVAVQAERARLMLDAVPAPLREVFAATISSAAEDRSTLESMAAALRNRTDGGAQAQAARLLVQARLAAARGAEASERALLSEAAATDPTLARLAAQLRLAALDADRTDEAGAHAVATLRDLARTFRFSRLGEDAAVALARSRLARGDYVAALAIADESAANRVAGASRGARVAAQILRDLLVGPARPDLPDRATRIALFWRYEGYATPGEHGDDIRLGAIRAMLAQHLPEAALAVTRQISPAVAARPEAAALIAMAEAEADNGDPSKALAGPGTSTANGRRAAAEALARLGRYAEAARQLDPTARTAEQMSRADLLFAARDWPSAAAAYGSLLREPALGTEERAVASSRYGIAAALSFGQAPNVPQSAASTEPQAYHLFALGSMPPDPSPDADPVGGLRNALARAHQIETMLNR
jgi:hypothetical protein